MSKLIDKLEGAERIKGERESVWIEFIKLDLEYKPLNLGQGFPDFAAPPQLTKALSDAATSDNFQLNQYTRGHGHPRLINALSRLYTMEVGHSINPKTEILITIGADGALYSSIMGHVNPGDEVIIIEPFFDCYAPITRLAEGIPVFIPMRPKNGNPSKSSDWILNKEELESKFSPKTKMIIVNTPNNPLGKVFNLEELTMIADLCKKYDCIALMDEVYERMVFDGRKHIRMASLPGMWDRTLTVGSAGKTFSVTGWKLGWVYGPETLMRSVQMYHQNCLSSCPTPIQEAVAVGFETEIDRLDKPNSYWKELSDMLQQKRDLLARFLEEVDMCPTIPEGGYFMLADFCKLSERLDFSGEEGPTKDYRFAKWLSKNEGIPPSAFYSEPNKYIAENYIRFCFMKKDETLHKAEVILKNLKHSLQFQ